MKKLMPLIVLLAICSLASGGYPAPVGHVNDFANILPPEVEQRLEQKLRDYERQTSVEIAVVTTNDLDGKSIEQWSIGLANQWGVGKRSEDNGVVFVVAPNHRKFRMETGSGIEGDLPDITCRRICEKYGPPNFKEERWGDGIEGVVDGIIAELGTLTPEQRAERKAKRAAEMKAALARLKRGVLIAGASIVGLILLVLILRWIYRGYLAIRAALAEKARKDQLRVELHGMELPTEHSRLKKLNERIQRAEGAARRFPEWAKGSSESHLKTATNHAERISALLEKAETNLDLDPDASSREVKAVLAWHIGAEDALDAIETQIPAEIAYYEEQGPLKVQQADSVLKGVQGSLNTAKDKGFRVNNLVHKLETLKGTFAEMNSSAGENPVLREMHTQAETLIDRGSEISDRLDRLVGSKSFVDGSVERLPEILDAVETTYGESGTLLDEIRKNRPASNWEDLVVAFAAIPGLIGTARELVKTASEKGSMERQAFSSAIRDIERSENIETDVAATLQSLKSRIREIEVAEKGYPDHLQSAKQAVASAHKMVRNSDVGYRAKNRAEDAKEKLHGAMEAANVELVDWLLVAGLLATAIITADGAKRSARSDIEEAESERRRKKREEEEAERRRRRRRSSSSSISSSSSMSSSSSFGGFGGGGFSGGGFSGGW
jgi:uncharacterized protein